MANVFINNITTAVPPHDVHDWFVKYVSNTLDDRRQQVLFSKLAKKSQISSRFSFHKPAAHASELDEEGFYKKGAFPSTANRMVKYKRHAFELASQAIEPLLKIHKRESITHVIITSCTGFYAPGLDLEIVKAYGLNHNVERTVIGFMGCYAAINALKSAYHAVRSNPEAKVLVVNLELCTLHLQESTNLESLLSFLQFADGCAASIISSESNGLEINGFECLLIPEDEKMIQWHIGDLGFDMMLSLEVPRALGKKLRQLGPRFKSGQKLWAIHPGGRSILDEVQAGMELNENDLRHSREVLSNYGNMSSPTIMFVLKSMMADSSLSGDGLAMAFGPGLSLETCRFSKANA